MSRWDEIRSMATVIKEVPSDSSGVHESLCRSYHILHEVKRLLGLGTPPAVVLELIAHMEDAQ